MLENTIPPTASQEKNTADDTIITGHTITPRPQEQDMLEAALYYAVRGWRVFPVHSVNDDGTCTCGKPHADDPKKIGKHPANKNGHNGATTDPVIIKKLFSGKLRNIGIATGSASGIFVVDIDGDKGRETMRQIQQRYGSLPATLKSFSGNGEHLYSQYPPDDVIEKWERPADLGIDCRGDKSYIIAPPSRHRNGTFYRFEDASVPVVQAPDWLIEFCVTEGDSYLPRIGMRKSIKSNTVALPNSDMPQHLQDMTWHSGSLDVGVMKVPAAWSQESENELRDALSRIPAEDREIWRDVGFALKWLSGTWGDDRCLKIYDDWAQTSKNNYNREENEDQWRTFKQDHPNPKTLGSIYELAQRCGWQRKVHASAQHESTQSKSPYSMTQKGLFFIDKAADGSEVPLFLSSPFEVVAATRDTANNSWGTWLRWKDHDGVMHNWVMPHSLLAGDGTDLFAELLDQGLNVSMARNAKSHLKAYLIKPHTKARVRCVSRIGWHGPVYVLPDRTFGPAVDEQTILQTVGKTPKFETKGTLQGWQQGIGTLAVGNSRLALAVSTAFAGPLLHLFGEESGGLHFCGPSSIGKSTTAKAATSVWGSEDETWRTTDNSIENLACGASDGLLVLDEIGQADPRVVDAVSYLLANSKGKNRMKRDGSAREVKTWRIFFLSTGEVGINEKLGEVGRKAHAGQSVRIVEVPADAGAGHGLFENLHGSENGSAFADRIKEAGKQNRGHAIIPFLENLAAYLKEYMQQAKSDRQAWLTNYMPAGADGQVMRVAGRFALIAAAGELATVMGILPWPRGEASHAAAVCFQAWLGRRGGKGPAEITAGVANVRAFLEQHGSARFEDISSTLTYDMRITNRAGFRRKDDKGEWEYLVLPEAWCNEVCKGHDAHAIAREMVKRKLMIPDSGGKSSRPETMPGLGKKRAYVVTSAIFGATDEPNQA